MEWAGAEREEPYDLTSVSASSVAVDKPLPASFIHPIGIECGTREHIDKKPETALFRVPAIPREQVIGSELPGGHGCSSLGSPFTVVIAASECAGH